MSVWNTYPITYRQKEINKILSAVRAGECVSLVGLSGAGKSNLVGFMAHRQDAFPHPNVLVDCNRLQENSVDAFFHLVRDALGDTSLAEKELVALDAAVNRCLSEESGSLSIILDRFEYVVDSSALAVFSNLRALRDAYKYKLTFVTATRRPLDPHNELSELFYAHTLWLGPLSKADTHWNVTRYAERIGKTWGNEIAQKMVELTWGYPSLLRATCEAYAGGANFDLVEMRDHPAVSRRVTEFWNDKPTLSDIVNAGLDGLPLLEQLSEGGDIDTSNLTAKENLLLEYLRSHPGDVSTKDDLIRAVWPEDQIYASGIRDDSLAQLVRRLRVKIEVDPSAPQYIHTIPGRGYRFTPQG
jgi:energy-coupling factor transporter ATP-binding protein EcfA2